MSNIKSNPRAEAALAVIAFFNILAVLMVITGFIGSISGDGTSSSGPDSWEWPFLGLFFLCVAIASAPFYLRAARSANSILAGFVCLIALISNIVFLLGLVSIFTIFDVNIA